MQTTLLNPVHNEQKSRLSDCYQHEAFPDSKRTRSILLNTAILEHFCTLFVPQNHKSLTMSINHFLNREVKSRIPRRKEYGKVEWRRMRWCFGVLDLGVKARSENKSAAPWRKRPMF